MQAGSQAPDQEQAGSEAPDQQLHEEQAGSQALKRLIQGANVTEHGLPYLCHSRLHSLSLPFS